MNETLKAIMERNSCRDFTGEKPSDEQIKTIVEAALAAPSAMNRMPWHVVFINDKAIVDELDAEGMGILEATGDDALKARMRDRGGRLFYNAPCIAVILQDGSKWGALDSGIMCQNITLAAQSLGLSSCIVGMAGIPLNGPKAAEYRERFKFPEGYEFIVGVLFGAANTGKAPHELNMAKVTNIGG